MIDFIKSIPITPDMVSLWVPSGLNRAQDLIRGNHGQVIGAHPRVPVIAPPIEQINACDVTTDWIGTVLSIDTSDKKEGSGSLKNTIAAPTFPAWFSTSYNPAGTWDWSDKEDVLFWLYCDRANTDFEYIQFAIYDTLNNYYMWVVTCAAGTWTAIRKSFLNTDVQTTPAPNLSLMNKVSVIVKTNDTTPFYVKLDDVRITAKPSHINSSVGWRFGGDDYIELGTKASLTFLDSAPWSYSHWINWDGQGDIRNVFYTGLPITIEGFILKSAAIYRFGLRDKNGDYHYFAEDSSIPYIGKWTYLTWVADGIGNLSLYVNKVLLDTLTSVPTQMHFTDIGRGYSSGNYHLKGSLALLSLANTAWSLQQHNNIYDATKGMFAPRS